jgi:TolB-like protein
LTENIEEYEISKVTVMDLVDENEESPILGEYLSSRVVEAITKKYYFRADKIFRVAQKGEVNAVMKNLNLKPSYSYNKEEIRNMGKALKSQALITGKITDLGTNIDVHLTLTDVMSGEVIASATEHLTRTKFAVEMLRHH